MRESNRLIPREVLFGNPDKTDVRLSPDGAMLSYLAPLDGVMNVWVEPSDDPAAARPVTYDKGRGISFYDWTYTNSHIVYGQDKDGDENWRVYSVDVRTGVSTELTPGEGVQAILEHISPKFPEEILVGVNDRDPQLHDIYRVNVRTGERFLVLENEGFLGFITDDDLRVRFAARMTSDGGSELLRLTDESGLELFIKFDMEDDLYTDAVGFDKTGEVLHMIHSRGSNTATLRAINAVTGEETTLAEDPRADISDVMLHPTNKHVQAAASNYERKQWQTLDDAISPDMEYLRSVADGDMEVVSRTLDDRQWVVAYGMDDAPRRYYRYHREERRAEFLFTARTALDGLPLARMHPVVIRSRDGLDLVSYYTLPTEGDSDAHPGRPLPMVLLVHGGPWDRDSWGYDPWHQWLANRGYAVLSVNFRGSTGFGKAFVNAGNLEYGGKMHDDLIDGVKWAIDQEMADPERIAIMGGSYGGYATLVGLTFTPETFACGVDLVGMSNLVTRTGKHAALLATSNGAVRRA